MFCFVLGFGIFIVVKSNEVWVGEEVWVRGWRGGGGVGEGIFCGRGFCNYL